MCQCAKKPVKVAVVGIGTIGTGVLKVFEENSALIEARVGLPVEVKWICDVDWKRERPVDLSRYRKTSDYREILKDPEVDIVVELIGGTKVAGDLILEAFKAKKHVVTANKALLAERGDEIFAACEEAGVDLGFEASVAGGIPIIKAIKESLAANRIERIYGIINGTANYVLTKMEEERLSFEDALKRAQEKGYAEADPTLDVEGIDAAHKAAILASLAFGGRFSLSDVYVEGVTKVKHLDVLFAKDLGYRIKLLAIMKCLNSEVELRVHPTLIPLDSSLAGVRGAFNALSVVGNAVGHTMFYGMGAGMMPTASAVVADVVDIARDIVAGASKRVPVLSFRRQQNLRVKSMDEIVSKYYLRFSAVDRPGVLSRISGILGSYGISIESVIQKGRKESGYVPIVMTTHEALESKMKAAVKDIDALDIIGNPTTVIRIENNLD